MLIPDRSHIATEQRNPRSEHLSRASVEDCVGLMQAEDHAVLAALESARPALVAFISAVEPRFARGGRLVYFGAGTSGRLGVLDASEAPPTFQIAADRIIGLIAGGDGSLRQSSEGKEDDPLGVLPELGRFGLGADDSVLGIAAGGTTPYVLGGLRWASNLSPRPLTALLSCAAVPPPPGVDHLVVLATGPEVLTGSTRLKAGTATKLALNQISTTLMVRMGKAYGNLMVDVRASNAKLRDRAARIIASVLQIGRDEAFVALDAADGAVKTAIVMKRLGLARSQAEARLAAHSGRLDSLLNAVGEPG